MNKTLVTNGGGNGGEIGYQLIKNANRNNQILSILNECIYQLESAQYCFIDTNEAQIKKLIQEELERNKNNNIYLTVKIIFDIIIDKQKDLTNSKKEIYKEELQNDDYSLYINGIEIYTQDIPKIEPLFVEDKFLILDENTMEFYLVDKKEKDKVGNLNDLIDIELFKKQTIEFLGSTYSNIPNKALEEFLDENPQYKDLPFVAYPQLDDGYPSVNSIDKIKDLVELLGIEQFEQLLNEIQYNVEDPNLPKEIYDLVDDNNSVIDVIKQELGLEQSNNNEIKNIGE